jgi:hypothetical protein
VHGHQLVELVRPEHLPVRLRELRADEQRLDPTRAEERERREEVEERDALVVDGRQPAEQSGTLFPDPLETVDALPCARAEDVDGYLRLSR